MAVDDPSNAGGVSMRDFFRYSTATLAGTAIGPWTLGCSSASNGTPGTPQVFTTAQLQVLPIALTPATPQVNPSAVPQYAQYGYSGWSLGPGLPYVPRTDPAIPWYQVVGNHDRFWCGMAFEDTKTMQAHVAGTVLDMGDSPNPAAPTIFPFFRVPPCTEAYLLPILHGCPNLILRLAGHRHDNVVTPQADPGGDPTRNFWVVETASLRDFPQQFRTFEIDSNTDGTLSVTITNVDPAVAPGSPAAASRGYAIGAARIFGATPAAIADATSHAYNAVLIKQLTPAMQTVLQNLAG